MGQKLHVSATTSDQSEIDKTNRKVFEEVFQILKLAWGDKPFSFKGEYYEYPYPYDTGTPWPPHKWTEQYGAPGEVGERQRKEDFRRAQALPAAASAALSGGFSQRRDNRVVRQAEHHPDDTDYASRRDGTRGEVVPGRIGQGRAQAGIRSAYRRAAPNLLRAEQGRDVSGWPRWEPPASGSSKFWGHFGFFEAFRLPGDEEKWPRGKALVPQSEWTINRMDRAHYLFMGSESDVRRKMDAMVEAANPEYFCWNFNRG